MKKTVHVEEIRPPWRRIGGKLQQAMQTLSGGTLEYTEAHLKKIAFDLRFNMAFHASEEDDHTFAHFLALYLEHIAEYIRLWYQRNLPVDVQQHILAEFHSSLNSILDLAADVAVRSTDEFPPEVRAQWYWAGLKELRAVEERVLARMAEK